MASWYHRHATFKPTSTVYPAPHAGSCEDIMRVFATYESAHKEMKNEAARYGESWEVDKTPEKFGARWRNIVGTGMISEGTFGERFFSISRKALSGESQIKCVSLIDAQTVCKLRAVAKSIGCAVPPYHEWGEWCECRACEELHDRSSPSPTATFD